MRSYGRSAERAGGRRAWIRSCRRTRGVGDWEEAEKTELKTLFDLPENQKVPSIFGDDVDNTLAWCIVAVPIVGTIIEWATGTTLVTFYILAYILTIAFSPRRFRLNTNQNAEPPRSAFCLITIRAASVRR